MKKKNLKHEEKGLKSILDDSSGLSPKSQKDMNEMLLKLKAFNKSLVKFAKPKK